MSLPEESGDDDADGIGHNLEQDIGGEQKEARDEMDDAVADDDGNKAKGILEEKITEAS